MNSSRNDYVSGKLQLGMAKVGGNSGKNRHIRSIFSQPLAPTKNGNVIKSISSDGVITVVRSEEKIGKLVRRKRSTNGSFTETFNKYLTIGVLSSKIGKEVKKPQVAVSLKGQTFEAWQNTQNSVRAMKAQG